MATFYPTLETIAKLKVPPTEGEWALLNFLGRVLDNSYEVYFNPYLNGDRPDVLIMRKGNGVLVVEVKDWNLGNFALNEKKKWIYTPNGSVVKSPIDQVLKYKNNLFDLHVDQLLEKKINDIRHFNIVACAVYFHCASQHQVENLLVTPFADERKYQDFLKYNIDLIGRDGLEEGRFNQILRKRYLSKDKRSYYFSGEIFENFKRILSPPVHLKAQGTPYLYSDKQKDIIYSNTLEQRVKGVFGSGKTTVLAARAVQAYKRALKRHNNPRILILTYNITLKNFIHDKLMRVDETFPAENFIIINYHSFINAELNNLNIDVIVPEDCPKEKVGEYLERNYYSNVALFEAHKAAIVKYDGVLIDEIQDYHRPWMEIIKNYFRDSQGDYVLFGDVKQNIYGQPTSQKDVVTNVKGVNELKYCYRSDFKVRDLAQLFQHKIFCDKYDVDDFAEIGTWDFFGQEQQKEGYFNYMYLSNTDSITALYNIIRGNILNKTNGIAPNDITVLGYTTSLLRLFDCYYRYSSRERTNSMLETIEAMYMTHLNFISKDRINEDGWFKSISEHLIKKLFPNRTTLYDNDLIKIRQHIAKLFTIFDLYSSYSETFINRLNEECNCCGISTEAFFAYIKHYEKELEAFKSKVYSDNYKNIRDNKKLHFWMNSGTIKISTINSFKGWESEVVFLIIEPKYETNTSFNLSFDELLYTGLTRCRSNLIVINFGNDEYDKKMRPIFNSIK
ncbi:MAG: NERD domain-containing protein [Muribaculaceae bacterium]|nr:NERD domain-containing protein [Muribaculaceae bacterium]